MAEHPHHSIRIDHLNQVIHNMMSTAAVFLRIMGRFLAPRITYSTISGRNLFGVITTVFLIYNGQVFDAKGNHF
jgi:hypothetical protein